MKTISLEDLSTVQGGMTVPNGPTLPGNNWTKAAKEGWQGYSDARRQGQGVPQSAWEGAKRAGRGLFSQ